MSRAGTVAIDVGGTFTDITFADAATGATWAAKTPSTPGDLSGGFITAVRKVLALAGRAPGDILHVFHGTTTATNAILEGKTPPTAVVTTAGFKYVLEIGRHDIPRHGNLYGWSKPARPVAPDRVLEVTERLDVGGAVLTPLDEAEARAVARQLAQLGVPAVAVVFLHAYANPAHERRMQAILQEEHPGVLVSLSSEVLPQFREFERTMATALNAAVMPPVSAAGRLTVGPRSAGAEPGPVCYGRGGAEPTVTDAHLVLGRIPPALLGGELPLDGAAARAAIDARVGRRLGLGVEEAAAGIVEIIDNSMARAIRTVSVGRGHDPRRFALVAFGGAGPLHACRLAELLEIPTVIIPPRPGVLSTWGLLDTDMRATFVRTVGTAERHLGEGPAAARGVDVKPLEATWGELEAQARAWLDTEEIPRDRQRFERSADLRYEHQSFELTCPLGKGVVTTARLAELTATFHAEHRRLYTYDLPDAPIELVHLRVTAIGALPRRRAPAAEAAGASHAMTDRRPVYFRGTGFVATPCYARGALAPGMSFEGPAIVTQDDSAPLVAPGFRARVDDADNILLERSRG